MPTISMAMERLERTLLPRYTCVCMVRVWAGEGGREGEREREGGREGGGERERDRQTDRHTHMYTETECFCVQMTIHLLYG